MFKTEELIKRIGWLTQKHAQPYQISDNPVSLDSKSIKNKELESCIGCIPDIPPYDNKERIEFYKHKLDVKNINTYIFYLLSIIEYYEKEIKIRNIDVNIEPLKYLFKFFNDYMTLKINKK